MSNNSRKKPTATRKSLIVYYSRTGTTRRAAIAVAQAVGADLLEVKSKRYPEGVRGYARALADVALGRDVPIEVRDVDLSACELLIVGTPVWGSRVCAPIRTFLAKHGEQVGQIAFFVTHGGSGARRVLRQMRDLAQKTPVATLTLKESEVRHDAFRYKLAEFVRSLTEEVVRRVA